MKREMTINNTEGLHAVLASKLVQLASNMDADVRLEYADQTVDAKSVLSLISLAIPSGENVNVIAEGPDAGEALGEIEKLLE